MQYQKLTDNFSLSGALSLNDIATLKKQGIDIIINSRQDREDAQQIASNEYQRAVEKLGMQYVFIPCKSLEYPTDSINRFRQAISSQNLKVHGFCRSGKRISHLWALAQASTREVKNIVADCAQIGIDLAEIMPQLNQLASQKKTKLT